MFHKGNIFLDRLLLSISDRILLSISDTDEFVELDKCVFLILTDLLSIVEPDNLF